MAKDFLRPIYKSVYGEKFNPASFESRMEMQKMIGLSGESNVGYDCYRILLYIIVSENQLSIVIGCL